MSEVPVDETMTAKIESSHRRKRAALRNLEATPFVRTPRVLRCSPRRTAMSTTVVRARIDQKTKDDAAAVLASIGLTVSDAFRLMMVRIAKERALPFEPLVPNKETIAAMKEARRGGVRRHRDAKAFLKSLNADD
jgi:DNA-damage-inducible protein J